MKKVSYIIFALWVVVAIALKIVGVVSWWVATSWIWLPLAIAFTIVLAISVSVEIGNKLKKKEERKIPDSCDTCLFGQAMQYSESGKCLGETMDEEHKFGELCGCYKRHIANNTQNPK